ncbi:hypothetical protein BDV95DRAFT_605159 [Massariosphaeria phaeospora]|uniref:Uncharacterized protein n=1 Tax=Massariosphaeria phaeospora TaxID=100035 RepID=A0A7C8MAL0_9PLEO|nr:hypothetical protein BDV95DRAFT_605159 [Massariosphaeria phaeospora]
MWGSQYGDLVNWNVNEAHRSDIIGFPCARLICEAQATLLRLLRRLVENLLENTASAEPESAVKWKSLVEGGLKKTGEIVDWSSYVYQPYSAPPNFNIDALVARAKARVDATGDHIWLLQTEPSYLRHHIKLLQQMHAAENYRGNAIGDYVVPGEWIGDINIHLVWRGVLEEFEHTQQLYHRFRDSIHPGTPLPREYDDALAALEVLLVNIMHNCSKQLQALLTQRPGFQNLYHQGFERETGQVTMKLKESFTTSVLFNEEPLYWCLLQLQGAPDDQRRFPYAMLLDFLDHHLTSSPTPERARLDAILFEKLSDYATIFELLSAVRLHRPKMKIGHASVFLETEDRLSWRRLKVKRLGELNDTTFANGWKKFMGTPPPSGRRDQKWLTEFDAVHKALQAFWSKLHAEYEKRFKASGRTEMDIKQDLKSVSFWDGEDYYNRLEAKRTAVSSDIAASKTSQDNGIFLPLPSESSDPSSKEALSH